MSCYKPIKAYISKTKRTENGKAYIAFKVEDAGILYDLIDLPCGQCIGCRLDRSKQWAIRCVHEASLFQNNCFITLTFNDEHLDSNGSLVKADFQKFMKRLRKAHNGIESVVDSDGVVTYPIRFFHCGEYGSLLERPHHHACLFNFDFADKVLWTIREGIRLYRSAELERLWSFGFCTIGDVTWESAAYVARYITKKVNGDQGAVHYARVNEETGEMFYIEPEYITMSRRPGIGKRWFDKYQKDVYPKDFVTHDGRKFKPPAYYDKVFDLVNPEGMEAIKKRRVKKAQEVPWQEKTSLRLDAKRRHKDLTVKRLKRGIEL